MREVAIIGAGELGGLVAHVLARRQAVGSIKLIDERGSIAAGKALDIMQAAPLEQFSTDVTGSSDLYAAAGADAVVIAEPAGTSEWFGGTTQGGGGGLALVRRLAGFAAHATIVCAGASHRELVEGAVRQLGVARSRIIGAAPEAFTSAARALVALEQDVSPRDVALSILGVPPTRMVIAWEDGSIAGLALTRLLSEPVRRRLTQRIAALWPVGPYALASAVGQVVDALAGRTRRLTTCFIAPDDSAGARERAVALPVRLGPTGLIAIVLPALSVRERVALENATQL